MVGNPSILEKQALKEKYLGCFGVRAASATAMQDAVKGLVQLGITRKTLHEWAVGAGFSAGYVRSHLSKMFCALGMRERAVGAGRKPSPDALELLIYARARYGDRFLKVLRGALRAGKVRVAAEGPRSGSPSGAALIVAPQLTNRDANGGATIKRRGQIAARNRASLHQPRGSIFKRNFNSTTHGKQL